MASHAEIASRLGKEIKNLQNKMDKEPDRRLKSSYQRRIEQIKNFLSEKLPQDQERASKVELNKRVEKADNFSDLMDID